VALINIEMVSVLKDEQSKPHHLGRFNSDPGCDPVIPPVSCTGSYPPRTSRLNQSTTYFEFTETHAQTRLIKFTWPP